MPHIIAGHQIVRRLAFGGMAEILLAQRPQAGGQPHRVVIKRILTHLRDEPVCVQMFLREAQLGLSLHHPNIVRTQGLSYDDGSPHIFMEYLPGCDLRQMLRALQGTGRLLCLQEVAAIGMSLARALGYAHAGGLRPIHGPIVHQDMTPSNVMLTVEGQVKLIDFGVATWARSDVSLSPNCIKGKVVYMSPEQATGERLTAKSDQFSLALVLWECLAGEPCYVQGSHFATLCAAAGAQIRPLRSFRPDLPAAVSSAIDRALQCQPEDRFDDIGQLANILAPYACHRTQMAALMAQAMAESSLGVSVQPLASAVTAHTQLAPPVGLLPKRRPSEPVTSPLAV